MPDSKMGKIKFFKKVVCDFCIDKKINSHVRFISGDTSWQRRGKVIGARAGTHRSYV